MIPTPVAALDSGTPPDVAYSDSYDVQAAGKWAFEGKLVDQDYDEKELAMALAGLPSVAA